jgi:hypothetical protein
MRIAPGFEDSDWRALQLNDPQSPDWRRAISIYEARIRGRFLDPAEYLIQAEAALDRHERRFGFAILALDCLLVETLQAFILGLTHSNKRSEEMFISFLGFVPSFAPPFTPAIARTFYLDFRCGILHQAEVGRRSRVVSEGPLLGIENSGLVVNRNEFHRQLATEHDEYIHDLQNPLNEQLRFNFRVKMNYIARYAGGV